MSAGVQDGLKDARVLEAVSVCVGFDDILAQTLADNHAQVDHYVVVTSHEDKATQWLAKKHGATCVATDLFQHNGKLFNKGAAINAGFMRFRYHGWRMHLDADILLADNFRRVLFNLTHLELDCIYGADRVDVVGQRRVDDLRDARLAMPQHFYGTACSAMHGGRVYPEMPSDSSHRFIHRLHGYVPIGFFQLWHASHQQEYPDSIGTAAVDDVAFGALWPRAKRHLLPSVFCYHVCGAPPRFAENWDGRRRQPRIDGGG
jgi:hypothetical protein